MDKHKSPLQKRTMQSASACIISALFAGSLSTMENLTTLGTALFYLAVISSLLSFMLLLVFAVRFSNQRKKVMDRRNTVCTSSACSINQTNTTYSTPIYTPPSALFSADKIAEPKTDFAKSADISSRPLYVDPRDAFAKYGGIEAELLTIDLMEGHEFEYWCSDVLQDMGYTNVQVTPGSGDQGVDILADMNGIKYAIQCKRYSSDLGNTPVQEVHAGKYMYHCHIGAVITNQHFTSGAKELAEATGILLWDRDWIRQYLIFKADKDGSLHIEHTSVPHTYASPLYDEMLPVAVDIVLETGLASVSMLQRRLNLGYARSARIVDEMEELGIVGPFEGSKPRSILITKEQWGSIKETNVN